MLKIVAALAMLVVLTAGQGGCTPQDSAPASVKAERSLTDLAQVQLLRNQPVPVFDFSLERHMLIEIYKARQHATNTYSFVQSNYTGKVLWACNSIGFPIPYATQITNPQQGVVIYNPREHDGSGVINQAEPNGLYSPAQADGTWVPCVGPDGKIEPVYEERKVTVSPRPMEEINGRMQPVAGSKSSITISPNSGGAP